MTNKEYDKEDLKASGKNALNHFLMFGKNATEAAVGGSKMAYKAAKGNPKVQQFLFDAKDKLNEVKEKRETSKPSTENSDVHVKRVEDETSAPKTEINASKPEGNVPPKPTTPPKQS